jgi:hypothetical protein
LLLLPTSLVTELGSTMLTPWVLLHALGVEVVQVVAAAGHNAHLNLRVAVASACGVSRQPRGPAVEAVYLRQLPLARASASLQAELRIQSLVVHSSISRRQQIQRHIPAPSHDAAYRIVVRGQAVPHDETQHSLVGSW